MGEEIALRMLISKGHSLVQKNKVIKGGEVDIITECQNQLYLSEIKSVTREKTEYRSDNTVSIELNVARENFSTRKHQAYRMHANSVLRGKSVKIQLICVLIDFEASNAFVEIFEV